MTESESEDEILERLESALRRIASAAGAPRRAASESGPAIDREALARSLDLLIARLRAGLKPANPAPLTPE
jgi:delta 1-pyrroline-5-carboxylate dehydrogenase